MTAPTLSLDDPEVQPDSVASQEVRRELVRPAVGGGLWLVLSLVLFVLSQAGGRLIDVVVVVAVLLFHEAGHYVAMRAFGYRDLKIFFVPFFGAMASGRHAGVAAWKQAVVSLAGPLPGIALGCALAFVVRVPAGTAKTAIVSLLFINSFNLLPLGGLDGGEFFRRIIFSRHRYFELAFQILAGVALLLLAVRLRSWALGAFASLGLVALPFRARVLAAAHALRADLTGLTDASTLDGREWSQLFGAARRLVTTRTRQAPRVLARTMEALLQATQPAPSILTALALAGAWLTGVAIAALGTMTLFARTAPEYWHTHDLGSSGMSVEMPYRPELTGPEERDGAEGVVRLRSGSRYSFAVSVWRVVRKVERPLADPPALFSGVPVSSGTLRGYEFRYSASDRWCGRRELQNSGFYVELDACAPEEAEVNRFLSSLRER